MKEDLEEVNGSAKKLERPLLSDHEEMEKLLVPVGAIWMVCLTVFIDSLGGSISAPVMPFYAQTFHASSGGIGLLFSSFSLAQVVALPFLGRLSDQIGRRQVLVMSLFGAAIGAGLQGIAPCWNILLLGRVVSGFCGAVGSTANVYVSDVTNEHSRPEYLGYLMSCNGLAFAFGPGLGGGLSKLGRNVPILVNSALCIVAGLFAFVYLQESPTWVRHQQASALRSGSQCAGRTGIRSFSYSVWAVCGTEVLRGVSFSSIFAMFAVFAADVYRLDSVSIGFAVCCGALCLICTNIWICPRLDVALGHIGCACLGLALIAFGELSLAYAPCLELSLIGMCIVYVGQAVAGCTIATITSVLATDDNRGCVMSFQQMAQAAGRVVGPVVLGALFSIKPQYPFILAALTALLGCVFLASLNTTFRIRAISEPNLVVPIPTPPRWADEVFTEEDIQDLGHFLCELLSTRHYKWRQPQQRDALKKALALTFPELTSQAPSLDISKVLNERRYGANKFLSEADPSAAAAAVGEFVRNTPARTAENSRRRWFQIGGRGRG